MNNELKISEILKELGVPADLSGYFCLKCAIDLMHKDMSLAKQITKRLYPEVAKQLNSTASTVERAIRHAVETGWNRGNVELQEKMFGYTIDLEKGKPTNSEFIVTVVDWLNMTLPKEEPK